MSLTRRARAVVAVTDALTRARLLPDVERIARQPVRKRGNVRPPRLLVGPTPKNVTVTDRTLVARDGGSFGVRIYTPRAESAVRPGLLYMHGGGWIAGGLESCDHICRRIATDAQVVVVSVDYSLAPQHPFPRALHECLDALEWLIESARSLGVTANGIFVGGDSAGGNLAAAVALSRVGAGDPPLAGQLLVYPSLDHTCSTPSGRDYEGPGLSIAQATACSRLYRGDADPADQLISPLLAPRLTGLPPTLVVTAGYDCLHDEGVAYAKRLVAAGIEAELLDFPDYLHGFLSLPRLYDGVEEAWRGIRDFLGRHP